MTPEAALITQIGAIIVCIISAVVSAIGAAFSVYKARNTIAYQTGIKFREDKIRELCKFFDLGAFFTGNLDLEKVSSWSQETILKQQGIYSEFKPQVLRFYFQNRHLLSFLRRGEVDKLYKIYNSETEKKFETTFDKATHHFLGYVAFVHKLHEVVLAELEETSNKLLLAKDKK
jgi:hypothetical protein